MAYATFEASFLRQYLSDFLIKEEYGQYLKQNMIRNMPTNFTVIDEILCLFIDQKKSHLLKLKLNIQNLIWNQLI